MNILLVEPDKTSQNLLNNILSNFTVTTVTSGQEALKSVATVVPGIVVLDTHLADMNGYELCRKLRLNDQMEYTPILFLTASTDLDDRLKAYDSGASDYLNKPLNSSEFLSKIERHAKFLSHQERIKNDIEMSQEMMFGVQTAASKIQSISRFIQSTLFIHDMDTLGFQFLKTAREIHLNCVLRIKSSSAAITLSNDEHISKLEEEILELASGVERIHSFGRDRAIYHWDNAIMLTRNIGDMIDIIAIFMDALEAGIKAIDKEQMLLSKVELLEKQGSIVQQEINGLFDTMNYDLKGVIISLGIVSGLDVEDEDKINNVLDKYSESINDKLESLKTNNQSLRQLLNDLRESPEHMKQAESTGNSDGAEFF